MSEESMSYAETLEKRIDVLEHALLEIVNWAYAFPLEVFPESDLKKMRQALVDAGLSIDQACSLDQVCESNMRHAISRVREIAKEALDQKGSRWDELTKRVIEENRGALKKLGEE